MKIGGITETEFDALPALLRRGVFRQLTGLSEKDLNEGIKCGEIKVRRGYPGGQQKFFKWQAEQMVKPMVKMK